MQRRVSLPGADELFRATQDDDRSGVGSPRPVAVPDPMPGVVPAEAGSERAGNGVPAGGGDVGAEIDPRAGAAADAATAHREQRSSGRVRHDEKVTVYVTADELFDLEHARLALRRNHGIAVDRGRMVREAVSIVLADLAENGAGADLVRRLSAS